MKRFEFATATRIIFGINTIREVPSLAAKLGRRAFVVTGGSTERIEPLLDDLRNHDISLTLFQVASEPTTTLLLEGVEQSREAKCDLVISMGGGSVIDAGKVIASMLTNSGTLMDYLEVIGQALPLRYRSTPHIAIPTTAGTGSEVTRNAVLRSPEHRVKVSLRSPLMLPDLAVIDARLTRSMPGFITASTGLDALTHLMEVYVSNQPNPLTDLICLEGIQRFSNSFPRVCSSNADDSALEEMALASLCGGMALANSRLGAVHGFAGPMGGMFSVPHGVLCARLLPIVMKANVEALKVRIPGSSVLDRYDEISCILTGEPTAKADDGVLWLKNLCAESKIPSLKSYGITKRDIPSIVEKSSRSSSMKGNPVLLKDQELTEVLKDAL